MDVAIVSDTHFGYGWETAREQDSFRQAREAFRRTVDADLVILPGDIYDHKVPKQEVLSRSIDCFNLYRDGESTIRITPDSDKDMRFNGTPLVAIHGTHERRTKGFVNPIELLEKMGYLMHLHLETVVFEKDGEKVAVHGMSGVPERYAPGVLQQWDPEPVEGAYNIFVFHQSVKNYVYTDPDHDVLTLEMLPDGFDLLVDGHIHWHQLDRGDDKPLILPGSTITTQMRKIEAEKPKGYVTVETTSDELTFHELETTREMYHYEIDVSGYSGAEITQAIADVFEDIAAADHEKRPLVRIKLGGRTDATVNMAEIRKTYESEAILSLSKSFTRSDGTGTGAESFQENIKNVGEMGKKMLHDRLGTSESNIDELFELLAGENPDDALAFVEEMDVEVSDGTGENDGQAREEDEKPVVSGTEDESGDEGHSDTDRAVAASNPAEERTESEESNAKNHGSRLTDFS